MPPVLTPYLPVDPADERRYEEAARYAVMRRLAPTLRHHLVGEFQPLTLLAALVERSLKSGALDRAAEHSLSRQSQLASQRCAALLDWVVLPGSVPSPASQALQECTRLVGSVLSLRGFDLTLHDHKLSKPLGSGVWRSLLPAALLHLSDQAQAPGHLHLRPREDAAQTLFNIHIETGRQPADLTDAPERPIRWDDVCALARAEGCGVQVLPDGLQLLLGNSTHT